MTSPSPAPDPDERPVVLAVDGNSLVHRAFHAQAASATTDAQGRPCWAVRGLLAQLVAAVERTAARAVVVGFDDPLDSWRRRTWPTYKAARAEKLETLVVQLQLAVETLQRLGVAVCVPPGLEADDVLASVARRAPELGARTVIVTSDRDSFALIDEHTRVLRIINGGVEASPLLTAERLALMLGVRPGQYRDYAALRGDPSDNLPGVRGFGPKSAARLLAALGGAAAAFDDVAGGGGRVAEAVGPALAARLAEPDARAAWELNCAVMEMQRDLSLELDLRSGPGSLPLDADRVRAVFEVHRLPWTTATALRVLAHLDGPPPVPVHADTAVHLGTPGWTSGGPRRLPRPRTRPQERGPADQLALF